jgi:uncharacterized protein YkwD
VKKVFWSLLCLCLILWLAACSSTTATHTSSSSYRLSDSLNQDGLSSTDPDATAILTIPSQKATPTPVPHNTPSSTSPSRPTPTPQPGSSCITFSNDTTLVPPKNGTLAAPYGPAPVTAEAQQLTTQLFQLINSDRAACGLPPFAWNATLASGALAASAIIAPMG